MPSFDVVSEVNMPGVTNALHQTNKELTTRFDLKDTGSTCRHEGAVITAVSDSDFHLEQVVQVLLGKLAQRKVNLRSLQHGEPVTSGKEVRQAITIRQGIASELGREIVKMVKGAKSKTQAAIMEDKVRITGKKKDELQSIQAMLRDAEFDRPLQFTNYRD